MLLTNSKCVVDVDYEILKQCIYVDVEAIHKLIVMVSMPCQSVLI